MVIHGHTWSYGQAPEIVYPSMYTYLALRRVLSVIQARFKKSNELSNAMPPVYLRPCTLYFHLKWTLSILRKFF